MEKGYFISDFDQTMFDTDPAIVAYINKRWEINSKQSDYLDNGGFHKIVQKYTGNSLITFEDVYGDYRKNFVTSFYWHENVEPMKDMSKVVYQLSKKYKFLVATMRNEEGNTIIKTLLEKFIPGTVDYVHHVLRRNDVGYQEFSKRDFILSLSGNRIGFIDDSTREILGVKDIIPSYLFDPNGLHDSIDGAHKVTGWKEIGDLFL